MRITRKILRRRACFGWCPKSNSGYHGCWHWDGNMSHSGIFHHSYSSSGYLKDWSMSGLASREYSYAWMWTISRVKRKSTSGQYK